jgi:methylmalonyl-CoA/ethylmalonyl-CoA epimerase
MFTRLDHLAIVVSDTEEALAVWRDRLGLRVVAQEKVNDGTVLLTHLDLGNAHLQLVQPLVDGHPLRNWLRAHGPGMHHFCLAVEDVDRATEEAARRGLPSAQARPHQGVGGKRAMFLDPAATAGVRVELTGA